MANVIGEFDILPTSHLRNKVTGLTLVIGTRKHPTPSKPKNYLLLRHKSGKSTYLSSLYEYPQKGAENGLKTYSMEWQGVYYLVTFDEGAGQVQITPKPNSANPINNAELGAKIDPPFNLKMGQR